MEIKEFTFNTGTVILNYAKTSSPGRPLVLLHGGNARWRDLCGGQKPLDQLIEILKAAPIEVPDKSEPVPMREVMGEDAPVMPGWLPTCIRVIRIC